jgi:hypothetical protein
MSMPYKNNELFWDIDVSKIDYEEDKVLIAERVLVKGTDDDERLLYLYYGKERLIEIIKKIEYLDSDTIEYVHQCYRIPKEEMACCIQK